MKPDPMTRGHDDFDLADGRWSTVYSCSYIDPCGREVIAAVSVRVIDRHGNAISLSDSALANAFVVMSGHVSVF